MEYKIVVLDLSTSEVHVFNYSGEIDDDSIEEFIFDQYSEEGNTFKASQTSWMIVNMNETAGRLPIYFH